MDPRPRERLHVTDFRMGELLYLDLPLPQELRLGYLSERLLTDSVLLYGGRQTVGKLGGLWADLPLDLRLLIRRLIGEVAGTCIVSAQVFADVVLYKRRGRGQREFSQLAAIDLLKLAS